jgi:Flp pilus assembly protein TadD
MRRSATLIALGLLAGLSGCANNPVLDLIRPASQTSREAREDASTRTPKAAAVVRVANASARRGDWPLAASLYRRALGLHSENSEAATGLATSLGKLGAYNDALEVWQHTLSLRPNDPDALRGVGNTLIRIDQPEQALPYFEQALTKSNDPRLFSGIGVASDMIGEHKLAQSFYRSGLINAPKDLSLRNNLALSLLFSGDPGEAVRLLRRVIVDPLATKRHRANLSLALVMAGETTAAQSISRMDLPADRVNERIAYFETLAAITEPEAARIALRNHLRGGG